MAQIASAAGLFLSGYTSLKQPPRKSLFPTPVEDGMFDPFFGARAMSYYNVLKDTRVAEVITLNAFNLFISIKPIWRELSR